MPYRLSAKAGHQDAWVRGDFPQDLTLGDDASVYDIVAAGDAASYGFVPRFTAANKGLRFGDLIWTTGSSKIASQRLLDALASISATGYKTFPIELMTGHPESMAYKGIAVVSSNSSDDLYNPDGIQWFKFMASDRLVAALRQRGAVNLSIENVDDGSA